MRRGAQDCEYLLTAAERLGLNREQLRALAARKPTTEARGQQLHADDAAAVSFERLDGDAFAEFREGVARLIEAAGTPAAPAR